MALDASWAATGPSVEDFTAPSATAFLVSRNFFHPQSLIDVPPIHPLDPVPTSFPDAVAGRDRPTAAPFLILNSLKIRLKPE